MNKLLFLFFCFVLDNNIWSKLAVMTYNLRLDVSSDGENAWTNRKEFLVSQIKFYEPDIFGTQEGLPHQISYIDDTLKNYSFIGQGREGTIIGEYSAVFYNTDKFKVIRTSYILAVRNTR